MGIECCQDERMLDISRIIETIVATQFTFITMMTNDWHGYRIESFDNEHILRDNLEFRCDLLSFLFIYKFDGCILCVVPSVYLMCRVNTNFFPLLSIKHLNNSRVSFQVARKFSPSFKRSLFHFVWRKRWSWYYMNFSTRKRVRERERHTQRGCAIQPSTYHLFLFPIQLFILITIAMYYIACIQSHFETWNDAIKVGVDAIKCLVTKNVNELFGLTLNLVWARS